ncbi:hypothetical protein [Roseovarius nitratireducens]|uniref:hypothetical protein n=1 Tax=Roseovarius nitratireducens TaxID=2044597 RepID=UPI000CE245C0|nr:hypothetical protein [Roseovarius nitratireducens]
MMWLAIILYLLPIAAGLRHFDHERDMVREVMMEDGPWLPALIEVVAFAMLLLWPIICLDEILSRSEGHR